MFELLVFPRKQRLCSKPRYQADSTTALARWPISVKLWRCRRKVSRVELKIVKNRLWGISSCGVHGKEKLLFLSSLSREAAASRTVNMWAPTDLTQTCSSEPSRAHVAAHAAKEMRTYRGVSITREDGMGTSFPHFRNDLRKTSCSEGQRPIR